MDIGSLTFVGNATVLLRLGPFTVLTDPSFLHRGQRAYLGWGLSSRRLLEPALQVSELPPLDAVVLSHLHGDHWDRIGRRALDRGLPIVTTPHAARRLQGVHGFRRAVGLTTWTSHTLVAGDTTLRTTALPGRHAPGPARLLLPPVMGTLLELGPAGGEPTYRLYLTGDTLMGEEVREVARRHPGMDLAVVHLGGTTLPGGLMVTMDASQGADLIQAVRPRRAVPVHTDDFDVFRSSLADFEREVSRRGLDDVVTVVGRGDTLPLAT